jgi:hypothetical protein
MAMDVGMSLLEFHAVAGTRKWYLRKQPGDVVPKSFVAQRRKCWVVNTRHSAESTK